MKRQTEPQGVVSLWHAASLDIDPFRLPVKYTLPLAGRLNTMLRANNQIIVGSRSVCIQKYILGRQVNRVRLPLSDFEGVALRISAIDPGNKVVAISINLHHRKLEYCIPLHFAFDTYVSGARLQTWSRRLGLPILVPKSEGGWRQPIKTLGKLVVYPPHARDQRFLLEARKSFLSHIREPGRIDDSKKVTGREITSWD